MVHNNHLLCFRCYYWKPRRTVEYVARRTINLVSLRELSDKCSWYHLSRLQTHQRLLFHSTLAFLVIRGLSGAHARFMGKSTHSRYGLRTDPDCDASNRCHVCSRIMLEYFTGSEPGRKGTQSPPCVVWKLNRVLPKLNRPLGLMDH